MNNLMISFFVLLLFLFHCYIRQHIRLGKVKEGLCALWCMDAVFAVSGTVLSFAIYHYSLRPALTRQNILFVLLYLLLTFFFLLLSPSGLGLLAPFKPDTQEKLLLAEYRFHDTLCYVYSFFLALLFFLPILLQLPIKEQKLLSLLSTWEAKDIFSSFYFVIFLILLPISLRQTFYWLKSLKHTPDALETQLLQQYRSRLHYQKRNHFL